MNKKVILTTGPSVFSEEIKTMVEEQLDSVAIYCDQNKKEDLDFMFSLCNGVVLVGGRDLHPTTYNSEITNGDRLSSFDKTRDLRELYIISECLKRQIPIFGICRGHQLIGVYKGLALMKDISCMEVCHTPGKIDDDDSGTHFLYINKQYQNELSAEKGYVSSRHHQALYFHSDLNIYKPKNLEVIGYAHLNYDSSAKKEMKIIEFMRGINGEKWISVQFHPEISSNLPMHQKVIAMFKKMI